MAIDYDNTITAFKFHNDDNFIRLLIGPVGCGKSVANCIEIFRRACQQEAGPDKIRRSRWAIVRNTYPELKSTTIKTWQDWFPEDQFGKIKWDSPITHKIYFPIKDDLTTVELEVIFLALDSEKDVGKLMSFEFTGIYINELQYIHPKIFEKCAERVGRYPPSKMGAPITWTGVIADTNPPSTRHWIYKIFENDRPSNFSLYKYEPALLEVDESNPKAVRSRGGKYYILNPNADYLSNLQLGGDYYLNQVPGKDDEEVNVSIQGNYGIIVSGKAVHPEYKDRLHYVDRELAYNPHVELCFGWDFGLTPAVAIMQFTPNGQLIVLAELYSEYSGLEGFVEDTVLPFLNRNYVGWQNNYISRHDPAGQQGAQTDQRTCQQILGKFGIDSLPAATSNAPTARREGLKYHLRRLTGGEPAFLLSSLCPTLREGLMGHYQYAQILAGGSDTRYHEKPLKNMHSHICEALEYGAMHYAKPIETKKNDNNDILNAIASQAFKFKKMRSARNG